MSASTTSWVTIAERIVQGVGVRAGELIYVREQAGRVEVLEALLLAIEQAGAVPLLQWMPPAYMTRFWASASPETLARWDRHRADWANQVDRIIVLEGVRPARPAIEPAHFQAWRQATDRLNAIEEARALPYLLVAVPTLARAEQQALTLTELDARLVPALSASVEQLQGEIGRIQQALGEARELVLRTTPQDELRMRLGERPLLGDDGYIDEEDRARGAIVSNLPAGSLYTTVLEAESEGSVWLPQIGQARGVRFHFREGRIEEIEAQTGRDEVEALFAPHSGEPRRISHIGIGLNPFLNAFMDWTLVDEHVYGALFLALGENRYMGGENESSLNIDFAIADGTLLADGQALVEAGRVVA
jgi:leucyl aminopeptidase (aminopeptidase T)